MSYLPNKYIIFLKIDEKNCQVVIFSENFLPTLKENFFISVFEKYDVSSDQSTKPNFSTDLWPWKNDK